MSPGVMKNPDGLPADLDSMIECERRWTQADPGARARLWTEKLAEVERRRARYQEALAADAMTLAELKAYLAQFDETRKTAEYEWETLWAHDEYVRNLEADREALVDPLEGLIYSRRKLTLKTSEALPFVVHSTETSSGLRLCRSVKIREPLRQCPDILLVEFPPALDNELRWVGAIEGLGRQSTIPNPGRKKVRRTAGAHYYARPFSGTAFGVDPAGASCAVVGVNSDLGR